MKRAILSFSLIVITALPGFAQRTDERDLLLFGEAWLDSSDYAWSRESLSRLEKDSEPGARVKDFGRLRIRFISLDEDLLGLDIRVLKFRYQVQLRGDSANEGISKLEGTRLPPVWLHSALGFSVGSDPASGFQSNIQAGEVFDLIDFRGVVPREIPLVGQEWSAKMLRKPDDRFRFREEKDRRFTCLSKETTRDGDKFEIAFIETLKVTSMEPSRSHEIRETRGKFWVILPMGRVEATTWESLSTEYKSGAGKGKTSDKVETQTKVDIVRRDSPPPKPREGEKEVGAAIEKLPLPPR